MIGVLRSTEDYFSVWRRPGNRGKPTTWTTALLRDSWVIGLRCPKLDRDIYINRMWPQSYKCICICKNCLPNKYKALPHPVLIFPFLVTNAKSESMNVIYPLLFQDGYTFLRAFLGLLTDATWCEILYMRGHTINSKLYKNGAGLNLDKSGIYVFGGADVLNNTVWTNFFGYT